MIKFTKAIFILTIIGLITLSSCRNGKKNPPLINLSETSMTVLPNQKIEVTVNYERGDRKVKELSIVGIGDEILIEDHEDNNTYVYEVTIPSNSANSTITISFTANDTRGNETSVDLVLTVETPFSNEATNGIINNSQGPSSHAWDFIENKSKSTSDEVLTKDIIDNTSPSTGDFLAGGWNSGSESTFVLVSDYNYDTASKESAKAAFGSGTEVSLIEASDLEVDNIVLIKLRGEDDYAVVKITEVYDDGKNGGTGGNSDYRKFVYKN